MLRIRLLKVSNLITYGREQSGMDKGGMMQGSG
jgi:hypothetical protein